MVIINTSDFCRTWNVTWSVMIAMHAGSPSNARCSFSHQCSSILYRCSANYKVKFVHGFLSELSARAFPFLFCFWCKYRYQMVQTDNCNTCFESPFLLAGEGMFMFNSHRIKNWLQWIKILKGEEKRWVLCSLRYQKPNGVALLIALLCNPYKRGARSFHDSLLNFRALQEWKGFFIINWWMTGEVHCFFIGWWGLIAALSWRVSYGVFR